MNNSFINLYLFGINTDLCDYSDIDKSIYEIDIQVKQDVTNYVVEHITAVFSIFCELGNKGGFSKPEVKLNDCNLSLNKI